MVNFWQQVFKPLRLQVVSRPSVLLENSWRRTQGRSQNNMKLRAWHGREAACCLVKKRLLKVYEPLGSYTRFFSVVLQQSILTKD